MVGGDTMRNYSSFLVRWWRAEAGEQRLSIRHVQSDAELTVAHPTDALEWMAARVADPNRAPPLIPGPDTPQPEWPDTPPS